MANIKVSITRQMISSEEIMNWQPAHLHGANNIFMGYVREKNMDRQVVGIEYDSYESMCEQVVLQISKEAAEKWWTDANILVIHRIGYLAVGEMSVAIVATTGHRDESYRISRYIIEEIKIRAPIWKKEFYTDGESEWVRGHALCQHRKVDHHESHGTRSCGGQLHPHEAG